MLAPWKESYDQPRQHIKKQRHYFAIKGPSSQGYGFSSSHVWMWELDYKESWLLKNWCFWTMVLEKTLESPLDCKEIQPVHPKGNQSWIFIGKLKLQYFGHLTQRTDSFEKTLNLGKIEGRRRGWQRMRWLDGITDSIDTSWVSSRSWWWTGRPGVLQSMKSQRVGHDWLTELNWTCETNNPIKKRAKDLNRHFSEADKEMAINTDQFTERPELLRLSFEVTCFLHGEHHGARWVA